MMNYIICPPCKRYNFSMFKVTPALTPLTVDDFLWDA